jgi:Flp pilus assembly protein TadD
MGLGRIALGLFLAGAVSLATPGSLSSASPHVPAGATKEKPSSGSILVYVRDAFGAPLPVPPVLSLTAVPSGHPIALPPERARGGWTFAGVRPGRVFAVHVEAPGYRAAQERVQLAPRDGASAWVIFFLQPSDARIDFRAPRQSFLLPPSAQKETAEAIRDLASGHIGSANDHLKKALRLAPENPLVNYLAGVDSLEAKELRQAEAHLVKSVSIDPGNVPALVALGEVRYRQDDVSGAIAILEHASRVDPPSWRVHWMLAACYLREGKFDQARQQAERARDAGKNEHTGVDLLLGEALEGLGEHRQASSVLEAFVKRNPRDRIVAGVNRVLKSMPEPSAATDSGEASMTAKRSSSISPPVVPPLPALPLPKLSAAFWIPPDVDVEHPFLLAGAACPLPAVLRSAGERAVQFAKDLQQFTATEDYESVEIKRDGKLGMPFQQQFSYLVFLQQTSPKLIQSTEMRDQSMVLMPSQMGGPLMDTGSPVLAFAFHPIFANDFDWKCEGLGEWRGQPAWVIRFRQRPDRPTSRLHGFATLTADYPLPLKGLAWVAANGNRVLRLETDMLKPLEPAQLMREHFAIDYQPVAFHTHNVRLWLPGDVDTYVEYRGHAYHHYHHFSRFELFWAGAGPTRTVKPITDKPHR